MVDTIISYINIIKEINTENGYPPFFILSIYLSLQTSKTVFVTIL